MSVRGMRGDRYRSSQLIWIDFPSGKKKKVLIKERGEPYETYGIHARLINEKIKSRVDEEARVYILVKRNKH